jgi:hypothetical protein
LLSLLWRYDARLKWWEFPLRPATAHLRKCCCRNTAQCYYWGICRILGWAWLREGG